MILDVDADLVEKAVLAAATRGGFSGFHREREAAYRIADPEARDRAFAEVHQRWFQALALDGTLRALLAEQPALGRGVARTVVAAASLPEQEGADLYVVGGSGPLAERRRVVVRLRPETLLEASTLVPLIRRELLFVADMLDPSFGYEPRLPPCPSGATEDRLLMDRYSALWDASVTGRLVRAGSLPPAARERALARYLRAFPMLADDAGPFERLFTGDRPSHGELVRLALDPRGGRPACEPGSRCPLCSMPSYEFVGELTDAVQAAIAADFPAWTSEEGACVQCVALYEAHLPPVREGARGGEALDVQDGSSPAE